MASNNFLSLLFCFNKNGQYVQFPVFQDLGSTSIVYVTQQMKPDANGVPVSTFVIVAQNPKSYQFDTYWVGSNNFLANLTLLQTALNGITQQNSFTLYTDWQTLQNFEQYTTGQSILISDLYTKNRFYVVNEDRTDITVNVETDLIYLIIGVGGDQTLAGPYYYNQYSV
jgi:hypothetical protein